ncbi:mitochondrial potassium channel-like [Liolophura sinensis]|uniref:mitochondrial potassium channel-like n=1 Tax=Liolophura sinensis TaxID=3198878 RepID=UPI003158FE1A
MATANRRLRREICTNLQPSYSVHRHLFCRGKLQAKVKTYSNRKASRILQVYEDIVGVSEVRVAQENVIQAEEEFVEVQENRRSKQHSLNEKQTRLRDVIKEREKAVNEEQQCLKLLRQESNLLGQIRCLEQQIAQTEQSEKDKFAMLSVAVRVSHDKEREKAKRTRYWSIIGSAIGATVGIIGTSANDYRRMQELRAMIKDSADQGNALREMESSHSHKTKAQITRIEEQLGELHSKTHSSATVTEKHTKEILDIVKHHGSILEADTKETSAKSIVTATAVCVGVSFILAAVLAIFKKT